MLSASTLDFAKSGRVLFVGYDDNTIRVWDVLKVGSCEKWLPQWLVCAVLVLLVSAMLTSSAACCRRPHAVCLGIGSPAVLFKLQHPLPPSSLHLCHSVGDPAGGVVCPWRPCVTCASNTRWHGPGVGQLGQDNEGVVWGVAHSCMWWCRGVACSCMWWCRGCGM